MYKQFREDGWPLCPACGEDGLWMLHIQPHGNEPPSLAECIEQIEGCALCEWEPEDEIIAPIAREIKAQIERGEAKLYSWEEIKAGLVERGMLEPGEATE